jgi:hypothetical protein
MYAAVPRITPALVAAMLAADIIVGEFDWIELDGFCEYVFANPKSRTLTLPSDVSLMFAGFRSR